MCGLVLSLWNTTSLQFMSCGHFWVTAFFNLSNCWKCMAELIIWLLGKSLKCTPPLKSNSTDSMNFSWWIFTLDKDWGGLLHCYQDCLPVTLLYTFHFLSQVNIHFRKGSFSLHWMKGMADSQMLHQMDFLQLMRNPNFKLAYKSELL